MLITEFDQAEYEKIVEREKREVAEKAEAKGRAEERVSLLSELLSTGDLSPERAAELLGVDVSDLEDALKPVTRSRRPFRGCS